MKVALLSSRLGIALYLLLPNRLVWSCLSREDQVRVHQGDVYQNTHRPDYANPNQYQNGTGFDSPPAVRRTRHRLELLDFLNRLQPSSVIEVGPGSGHLTRAIVEFPSVHRYVAVDLNRAFLEHLQPRLERVAKPGFSFGLVWGTIESVREERFDAAVLVSSVHHIPDRLALFQALAGCLRHQGRVIAIDPTHYLLRLRKVLRKVTSSGYLAKQLEAATRNQLSTHAMCQLGEYRAVTRRTGLAIARVEFFNQPRKVSRLRAIGIPLGPFWRWMSQEMVIECVRR